MKPPAANLHATGLPGKRVKCTQTHIKSSQIASSVCRNQTINSRTHAIERTGDLWRGKTKPRIRIEVQSWERASFKPRHQLGVQLSGPGAMRLRFLGQVNHLDTANQS